MTTLDEIYPKYQYIKEYLLKNVPFERSWSDVTSELLKTLWPDSNNIVQNKHMLYALLYIARNKLPVDYLILVGQELKKQYSQLFNVKDTSFMYDQMHAYAYTVLYNNNILVNNVKHPDGKSDLIDATDKFNMGTYYEHKGTDSIITVQKGENYTWQVSYSSIQKHIDIAIGPIELHSPDILKTITERDKYLQWLSNNDTLTLIKNVLSILSKNHESINDVSPWLLEHFISTLERNLPVNFNVRKKITIASALGLSIENTENILTQNDSSIDTNVAMPTIEFN